MIIFDRFWNYIELRLLRAIRWLFPEPAPLSLSPEEEAILKAAKRVVHSHLMTYEGLTLLINESGYLADNGVYPRKMLIMFYRSYPHIQEMVDHDALPGSNLVATHQMEKSNGS